MKSVQDANIALLHKTILSATPKKVRNHVKIASRLPMKLMKCDNRQELFNPLRLMLIPREKSTFNSIINSDPASLLMKKRRNLNRNRGNAEGIMILVTHRENVSFQEWRGGEGRGGSRQRARGEKTMKFDVCTRERRERGVKEKDIRVRKNESIRADAEGPSTADKRDS